MCVRTTHEWHLVVFIAVQNLVGIEAVLLIICMFFPFHEFGLKTPIHAPKMGVFGGFDPLNVGLSHRDPQKALMVAETRRMSH